MKTVYDRIVFYKIYILFVALSFVLVLPGCHEYAHENDNYIHPHVVMKSVSTVDRQANEFAKIFIEFENVGDEVAYDISGILSLHIGNTIIESNNFLIDEIGTSQTVVAEIWLTSINTHDEYEYFSLEFGWYDYWDQYYE